MGDLKQALKQMLTSKKFLAGLAATLVGLLAHLGFAVDVDAVLKIISPLMTYIVAQGFADFGKEKARQDAE